VPPFDDVNVRRAANLAIDRAAAATAVGDWREANVTVAHHALPDAVENALLRTYDPYPSNGDGGDIDGARDAMRQSEYDTDGDGRCDAPACARVPVAAIDGSLVPLIGADLAEIGIELVLTDADPFLAESRVAAFIGIGWGVDYPNGANFSLLLSQAGISAGSLLNFSLLGGSTEQLASWGYEVTQVPSLNGKVDSCRQAVGGAAFLCWAELDQLIMERVVPWIPLAFVERHWIVSERVAAFSPDPESVGPALEQVRLHPTD